jgi:Protein of unknown function (DUF3574)
MPIRCALVLVVLGVLAGCCHPRLGAGAEENAIPDLGIVRLYFGRSAPSGDISSARFQDFVTREIVPRFPAGLTVYHTQGVWRGADGSSRGEPSEVIEVVAVPLSTARGLAEAIADRYKAEFAQESVLIVTLPGTATFR